VLLEGAYREIKVPKLLQNIYRVHSEIKFWNILYAPSIIVGHLHLM
jgi:hypothetical protein